MKRTNYFPHDYKARYDNKIIHLRMKHGLKGYGLYWVLVEMLFEEGGYLPISEIETIAYENHINASIIESVINDFGLFEIAENNSTMPENNSTKNFEASTVKYFYSNSVIKRLEIIKEKSDKARASIRKRWELQKNEDNKKDNKSNTNTIRTYNERNTNVILPKIKENKSKVNIKEKSKKKTSSPKFIKPTIEEIYKYGNEYSKKKELNLFDRLDAEKFYNFYESKGWKIGKTAMKNWEATVRNWILRNGKTNNKDYNPITML